MAVKEIDEFCKKTHKRNVDAGWWDDLEAVKAHLPVALHRKVETWFLATKIALIHSEVSEMLEGLRKGKQDKHLPYATEESVEAADVLIRLADYCGNRNIDLGSLALYKMQYNARRTDHTKEARALAGGKSI